MLREDEESGVANKGVPTIVINRIPWVRGGRFSDIFVTFSGGVVINGGNKFYNNGNKHEGNAYG